MSGWISIAVKVVAWGVALGWAAKLASCWRGLPRVPDLLDSAYDTSSEHGPSLTVIVPARNEAKDIGACLESLVAQEYRELSILAVDDRSTDATGAIMDDLAVRHPGRLRVLHLEVLPSGWLGKTHAMAVAASQCQTDYLLFTDADILFRSDALRRTMAAVTAQRADHFVTLPTTIIRRWDEGVMLGFFQIMGLFAVRLWKVADLSEMRDAVGVGAFNLVRRKAYESLGGFAAMPMEIVEDLGLARRIKRAGLRQQVAFGRGLVSVHWAAGAGGIVKVMTKNLFSAFNFHLAIVLTACVWLTVFTILPTFGLLLPATVLPAALIIACTAALYGLMQRRSGIAWWNGLLAPMGGVLFVYAVLRSAVTTLRQGGVVWRGTFYSLAELRSNMVPLRLK